MNTYKILVVEDESIIANDIQRTLQRLGYRISDIVTSGRAALESVARNLPDLVLMDIKLKGDMDGIETARCLYDEYKTPVVYLTAHSTDDLIHRAKLSESFGYIVKPFIDRSLHTTIEMAVHKSRMERERERLAVEKEKICSDMVQSEEELQKTVKALLHSNEELEQFTAIASHDLKSPLCNIISYSEALEEEVSTLGEEGKNYLQVIQKSAARMNRFINDLLEFAKISHIPKAFQEIDLQNMIAAICHDLEVKIKEKNAIVEVGELPRFKAEPLQLQHVFQNLIENALKYGCAGDRRPVIKIDGKIENGFAEIHVRDNGIGFDEKSAEEIFEPFKQLNRKLEGAGIGLAICKKIVENHGGQIAAKGRINEGSDFIIKLPVKDLDIRLPQSSPATAGGHPEPSTDEGDSPGYKDQRESYLQRHC